MCFTELILIKQHDDVAVISIVQQSTLEESADSDLTNS